MLSNAIKKQTLIMSLMVIIAALMIIIADLVSTSREAASLEAARPTTDLHIIAADLDTEKDPTTERTKPYRGRERINLCKPFPVTFSKGGTILYQVDYRCNRLQSTTPVYFTAQGPWFSDEDWDEAWDGSWDDFWDEPKPTPLKTNH